MYNLKTLYFVLVMVICIVVYYSFKTKNNAVENTQKTILVKCKSNQRDGTKLFNSEIEIFPMRGDVLRKINKTKVIGKRIGKSDAPIYAVIKNIELYDRGTLVENSCQGALFYGSTEFAKLSTSYDNMFISGSKNCSYGIFLSFKEITLLQEYSNNSPKGSPFLSICQEIKTRE